MKKLYIKTMLCSLVLLSFASAASAAAVVRSGGCERGGDPGDGRSVSYRSRSVKPEYDPDFCNWAARDQLGRRAGRFRGPEFFPFEFL